jgi:ribosomal protein S18 acetylase RimI-like enzyme
MKKSNALFLIAKSNNKVIGYALGWVQKIDLNHKINEEGYICNVYVLDEYRKQKIGKLLTDNLIKWFKEKGIKRAVLDITEKNKLGLNFWERYGFGLHPFRRMCLDL